MSESIRPALLGFIAYVVVVFTALVPNIWPPELNLIFNKLFWSGVFLFVQCCFLIGYLYRTRGGSARHVRFSYGLLLVIASALMFSGFEQVAKNVDVWQPHFVGSYSKFFVVLKQLLTYVKDIISFGFAALGANIAASAIIEHEGEV